jgi:hypothetical protein
LGIHLAVRAVWIVQNSNIRRDARSSELLASRVSVGMSGQEVVQAVGQPDSEAQADGIRCFEYDFGRAASQTHSVYFDAHQRVVEVDGEACDLSTMQRLAAH